MDYLKKTIKELEDKGIKKVEFTFSEMEIYTKLVVEEAHKDILQHLYNVIQGQDIKNLIDVQRYIKNKLK